MNPAHAPSCCSQAFLRSGTPVVLTGGLPLTKPLIGKWSFAYLADHYAGPPDLNVHFTPRSTTRFARFYGEGAGEGGILAMGFKQFADVVARNEGTAPPPWRHYMQATLLWARGGDCGGQAVTPTQQQQQQQPAKEKHESLPSGGTLRAGSETVEHLSFGTRLKEDLEALDYDWLERSCALGGCEGMRETNLWAGASGGCTPLHFDETSNFLCQVRGRKRLLLFLPGQTAKLYPYPVGHPAHAFSMVDVEQPDLASFPSFARAQGLECVLEPGECLWMPSYVWHYVKQFEGDETLSLNFWVGSRSDVRKDRMYDAERRGTVPPPEQVVAAAAASASAAISAAGSAKARRQQEKEDDELLEGSKDGGLLCMQMARHVEREATNALCGDTAHAGRFLSALAVGADARWPPGSPAQRIASQVREHLITVLGAPRAAAILRGVARDGRLDPGLAPPLGAEVVGTEERAFSSRDELRKWVRSGGDVASRKAALL